MSYKPDESTWISYLYGELSEAERKQAEDYLKNSESARKELDELKEAHAILGKLKDREVDVPTFSFSSASNVIVAKGATGGHGFWKYSLGLAASLALLLVVGYLTTFKASYQDGYLQLSFGNIPTEVQQETGFSEDQVKSLITEALNENRTHTNEQISLVSNDLKQSINSIDKGELDQELLDEYLVQLRLLNSQLVRQMMEEATWEQRNYTDRTMQDLAIYLNLQRQEDMNIIQTQFENLADDTKFNIRQTNQMLNTFMMQNQEIPNQF